VNSLPGRNDIRWHRNLTLAAKCATERGSIAADDVVDGVAIGRWMSTQRAAYRTGRLSRARQQALDEAIPGWESGRDRAKRDEWEWKRHLTAAAAYLAEHGGMPHDANQGRLAIGRWLARQRAAHRRGTLAPDRRLLLDHALPGWEPSASTRPGMLIWRHTPQDNA